MNKSVIAFCLALAALAAGCSKLDQPQPHRTEQPYAGLESRGIKVLSEDRIAGLLEGKGLQYALAAELNHYPGPKHALELRSELGLTAEQERQLQSLADAMSEEAKRLGRDLVELERQLDEAFASKTIGKDRLKRLTEDIATVEGRLRYAHLQAHLDTRSILTEEQTAAYDRLRGYDGTALEENAHREHNGSHRH